MSSPINPNQQHPQPTGPLPQFFNPIQNPNPNLTSSPPIAASYPPPSGPYAYPPPQQQQQFHHQRSIPHSPPPLLPPQQPFPNSNHGARLMALLTNPNSEAPMPPQLQPTSSGGSDISMTQNLPPLQVVANASNVNVNNIVNNVGGLVHSSPVMRMQSSKLPKGRHLAGDHVVYDIDVRLMGEMQPQLEVTPITKYGSDPGLVVGRQIAVNKSYICYGLKLGAIRVLNINTALRSLLKGLSQRVTDMAFFAEDVHLLASASVDGRVYIWKIIEGPGEEEKSQITGNLIMAIQIVGEGDSVHPRICWHCHKQEVLVVGIGRSVLRIDTTKVGKGEVFSADDPLRCHVDKMIDGVQFVGNHDGEVTDLSMCQWMTTRLVSASLDGTIKVWEDRKSQPIAILRPHNGLPVNSATFLTSPHRPDHIVLITGGPLNREVKIWTSTSEEGWLSDTDSWQCTQTLELRSSAAHNTEAAFFNQVLALSQAGLLLLANAKKNAIYAVHLEYGLNPAATRMDYIAEFTVTMPILSFTGTDDLLPQSEQIVQIYCVQTQAIQQYALDLSQCLPPPLENVLERSDSSVSRGVTSTEGLTTFEPIVSKPVETLSTSSQPGQAIHEISSESVTSTIRNLVSSSEVANLHEVSICSTESRPHPLSVVNSDNNIASISSSPPPPLPLSPKLSPKLSGLRSPSSSFVPGSQPNDFSMDQNSNEYTIDRQMDAHQLNASDSIVDDDPKGDGKNIPREDMSNVLNDPIKFKHPTHLVTPSEILRATSSTETNHIEYKGEEEPDIQDVGVNSNAHNAEAEVKVVGETHISENEELASPGELDGFATDRREKLFYSQAADLGLEMARETQTLPLEPYIIEESRQVDGARESDVVDLPSSKQEEVQDSLEDISEKDVDSSMPVTVATPAQSTKRKKQKTKSAHGSSPISSAPSVSNSTDSYHEPGVSSSAPSVEAAFSQLRTMQETINQLLNMQKEMQKQISVAAAVPVNKEGKRLETALGKFMEKAMKANSDALWARLLEENAKQEKLLRDRTQQILNLVTNSLAKDLPAALEKMVKKEVAAVGAAVARTLTPAIEKTVSIAITEAFQRGVGDKAVNQLEKSVNSKLEATVARHIQTQFQTSGKQILQEALKSSLETSVVPSFEMSCKAMFEQVDTAFQKGMTEHTSVVQHQFESAHSPLALALREIINSASSVTQTISSELVDGQRKLLALAVGASSSSADLLVRQQSNGSIGALRGEIEGPLDPRQELSRLISEQKYEEAFTIALQRSDVFIVSWLCSQADLSNILLRKTLPLSQGVLLSLLQQLACDISRDTSRKLVWMRDVAMVINPVDLMIVQHVKPIFEQVYQILNHHLNLPTTPPHELSSMRLVMHVINSLLATCSK